MTDTKLIDTPFSAIGNTELKLTPIDDWLEAAECLRMIAHPIRLRMIEIISQGRFSVGEIAEHCGIVNHMASTHLRLMQRCGLLESERSGREVYYVLIEPCLLEILNCISKRNGTKKELKEHS